MATVEITIPDIGNVESAPVTELFVQSGDEVTAGQSLFVLESEKSSVEIPAPAAGTVELTVAAGDSVSHGDVVGTVASDDAADAGADGGGGDDAEPVAETAAPASAQDDEPSAPPPAAEPTAAAPSPADAEDAATAEEPSARHERTEEGADRGAPHAAIAVEPAPPADRHTELLVLGSGPGGYAAAFRAADLGMQVTLVERTNRLGGVCLNVGCIPSKALLHAAKVVTDAEEARAIGIGFEQPQIDLGALRSFKEATVARLTGGLAKMAEDRRVRVLNGDGAFAGPRLLEVTGTEGTPMTVSFDQAIVAVGSSPAWLPFLPELDDRVMTSTGALALHDVPERLIVIGGGIIGLEMACVYDALGAEVTVVEMADRLIPEADDDLVRPLAKRIRRRYADILLKTTVESVEVRGDTVAVTVGGRDEPLVADRVLVAIGRRPNGHGIGLERAGVEVDERGFIAVDEHQCTSVPHILAVGDVTPGPMLAHKASAEGHVAAEVAAGLEHAVNDVRAIPSVAYTEPEIGWVGLTERRARADGVPHEVARFPWAASGRALTIGASDGLTKLLHDPETGRILGGGAVGPGAGELIAEVALAIEMGANVTDMALTVHPHPTLSESFGLAAELADGSITDLPNPQVRRKAQR